MDKSESLGVVSGAYFVGRIQLLKWINDLTKLNYSKIEQTASGVFVCHVFDALYPGQLRLEKVKFNARHSYDYIHNYKVLQACFDRVGMKRQIDVEKLVKGKYQDNLEFMQWVKAYYETHASEDALKYDGQARREEVLSRAGDKTVTTMQNRTALSDLSSNASSDGPKKPPRSQSVRTAQPRPPARPRQLLYPSQKGAKTMTNVVSPQTSKLKEEIAQLKTEKEDLQSSLEDAETEREFYFGKLRKVEVIYQSVNEDIMNGCDSIELLRDALDEIKNALYAEDEVHVENPEEEQLVEEGDLVEDGQLVEEGKYEDVPVHEYEDALSPGGSEERN